MCLRVNSISHVALQILHPYIENLKQIDRRVSYLKRCMADGVESSPHKLKMGFLRRQGRDLTHFYLRFT